MRGRTRRLLAVFPTLHSPPVAVFGVRSDGTFEESSVRSPVTEKVRCEIARYATADNWKDYSVYLSERTPRPVDNEIYDVPTWVSPSMLHCILYLLSSTPLPEAGRVFEEMLEAFASGADGPSVAELKSLESMIPVDSVDPEQGVVPPIGAMLRTFWHWDGRLSTEKFRELEALDRASIKDAEG